MTTTVTSHIMKVKILFFTYLKFISSLSKATRNCTTFIYFHIYNKCHYNSTVSNDGWNNYKKACTKECFGQIVTKSIEL